MYNQWIRLTDGKRTVRLTMYTFDVDTLRWSDELAYDFLDLGPSDQPHKVESVDECVRRVQAWADKTPDGRYELVDMADVEYLVIEIDHGELYAVRRYKTLDDANFYADFRRDRSLSVRSISSYYLDADTCDPETGRLDKSVLPLLKSH